MKTDDAVSLVLKLLKIGVKVFLFSEITHFLNISSEFILQLFNNCFIFDQFYQSNILKVLNLFFPLGK